MQRAILLQTEATRAKEELLKDFNCKATELANFLLSKRKTKKLMDLHKEWYSVCKRNTSMNSQVICDIERFVAKSKGKSIKHIAIKFNVPRNCKVFTTKEFTFVKLVPYSRKPICVPIRKNRNYQRYNSLVQNGWECKTYGLTYDGQIVAYLSKEKPINGKKNVVGVDVNSKCFAVSVLSHEGKILRQLYFGKDIWVRRKKIMARRSVFQSHAGKGSHKAITKLRSLKNMESNFVKNRIGEVVRDITNLALEYDADIGIEKLRRFKPKGRKYNKEVLRMPFSLFKKTLQSRCFDKDIAFHQVDPYHTSKWCSHCGAVVKNGHSSVYAMFKCVKCGQVVNSDRKSSLAVAVKTSLVRNKHTPNQVASFQFTRFRVPVNGLFYSDDGVDVHAVHDVSAPMESPLR